MKVSLFRIAAMTRPLPSAPLGRTAAADRPHGDSNLDMGLGLTTPKNVLRLALPPQPMKQNSAKDVREIILAPVCAPDEACERIGRGCEGSCLDLVAPAANENRVAVASEDGDAA
jgi:hypothetical protein